MLYKNCFKNLLKIIEKCALLDSDLCFEIKIKEAVVKIGPDGTDDDVTLTFCSDVDTKQVR